MRLTTKGRFAVTAMIDLALLQEDCPPEHLPKLRRLMEFAPAGMGDVVADPYYGGARGFETVLDHVEAACEGLLRHVRSRLGA